VFQSLKPDYDLDEEEVEGIFKMIDEKNVDSFCSFTIEGSRKGKYQQFK